MTVISVRPGTSAVGELALESFYPADEGTAGALRDLAR